MDYTVQDPIQSRHVTVQVGPVSMSWNDSSLLIPGMSDVCQTGAPIELMTTSASHMIASAVLENDDSATWAMFAAWRKRWLTRLTKC